VADDRSLYDFLNAISSIAPEFASIWIINIQTKIDLGEQLPDLHKIIELFRNNRRLYNAQKGHAPHGAFTVSFQGQSAEDTKSDTKSDNKSDKDKKLCLCGEEHRWRKCRYLIESLRPKDWKPDPNIQKKIDEKLQNNAKLKDIIKRIRKQIRQNNEKKDAN